MNFTELTNSYRFIKAPEDIFMYWLHINGVIHDLRFLFFQGNVYRLPSAENWPGARSGLKLFYRSAANNTLEAHVELSRPDIFLNSLHNPLENICDHISFESRVSWRIRSIQIKENDRGRLIERIIEFPHECFVSQSYVSFRSIKIFEFFIL